MKKILFMLLTISLPIHPKFGEKNNLETKKSNRVIFVKPSKKVNKVKELEQEKKSNENLNKQLQKDVASCRKLIMVLGQESYQDCLDKAERKFERENSKND